MHNKDDRWEAELTVEKNTTVYLGDFCYVLNEDEYVRAMNEVKKNDSVFMEDSSIIAHSTAGGDGGFTGQITNRYYPADSGKIGAVINTGSNIKPHPKGAKFTVKKGDKLKLIYDEGTFQFYINGQVKDIIPTEE